MAKLAEQLEKLTPLQRAVFALKETQARLEALQNRQNEPVAIVGIGCRFPGGAVDTRSYWQLLRAGRNAIRETPPDRWNVDAYFDPDPQAPGKMNTRWGGYLDDVDRFDNLFFGIADREAETIDPQQRILLELSWEALEDAGLPASQLKGTNAGVFVGISVSDYAMLVAGNPEATGAYVGTGSSLAIAANRISFAYDLRGPSVAIDTACSSSLVALHMACQSLRQGECSVALVGGVNLSLSPFTIMNLTKAGMTSGDGQVRPFDARAAGFVRSDGACVIVLKRLSAAVADGDAIYAIVRGSAVNTSGQGNGLSAPNRAAQEAVLEAAYTAARVEPAQVQYVETQGTATLLGDAIEAQALGNFFGRHRTPDAPVPIGSVKSNLGHTEAAAGLAGLVKVALAMQHGELPPTLNFETPNPNIDFARLPIKVQQQLEPWPAAEGGRRYAGVSAFGFGGSNAHVVLEQPPATETTATGAASPSADVLVLSAKTEEALRQLARRYVDFLRSEPAGEWHDICYTAGVRREHLDCRLAVTANSADAAAQYLEDYLAGNSSPVTTGRKPYGRRLKVAAFFGDTAIAADHGDRRITELPAVSQWFGEANELLLAETKKSLDEWRAEANVGANRAAAQRLIALVDHIGWQRAMADLSVAFSLVAGSGIGEVAAAVASGGVEASDALRAVVHVQLRGMMTEQSWNGDRPTTRAPTIPIASAVDGQLATSGAIDLLACLRRAERQGDERRVAAWLTERSADVVLALGRTPARPQTDSLAANTDAPRWISLDDCSSNEHDEHAANSAVLHVLQQLYSAGADLAWKAWYPSSARCVRLPLYAWQHRRHWLEAARPPRQGESRVAESARPAASPEQAIMERPDLAAPYVEPTTPLQREMCQAWAKLLKLDRVGIHDNFFELGADSLQATILLNQLQQRLGETIPTLIFFECHTIADLASRIESEFPDAVQRAFSDSPSVTAATNGSTTAPASDTTPAAALSPEQLLEKLDELSDEEVDRLLQQNLAGQEKLP